MKTTLLVSAIAIAASPALATNLITNPGFEDLDTDGSFGDGWGSFGAQAFLDFFNNGNPGHATLFGDNPANFGGFFQAAIPAVPNTLYEFQIDANFESNWDARTRFGLEFYEADDATAVGTPILVEVSEILGSYNTISMTGVAPAGAAIIRPIVIMDQVVASGGGRAATFDNAILTVVPAPGAAAAIGLAGIALAKRRR